MPEYQVELLAGDRWACAIVRARDEPHAIGRAWRQVRARGRGKEFPPEKTVVRVTPITTHIAVKREKA